MEPVIFHQGFQAVLFLRDVGGKQGLLLCVGEPKFEKRHCAPLVLAILLSTIGGRSRAGSWEECGEEVKVGWRGFR
jgi:hypothetical protein